MKKKESTLVAVVFGGPVSMGCVACWEREGHEISLVLHYEGLKEVQVAQEL